VERDLSWCDKLASTPSLSVKLDYHFLSSGDILRAISPITDKMIKGDKASFRITKQDAFNIDLDDENGYLYAISSSNISVEFRHHYRVRHTSAGPPVVALLTEPLPFTTLLPIVTEKLIETTLLIAQGTQRKITRVGVVATTTVALEDAPPGIARFIAYVSRPWKGRVDFYSLQITGMIDETPDWSDRCVHQLTKLEDPDAVPSVKLDWQRTFTTGRPVTRESMKTLLSHAEVAANKYFEDVAEGNRFDEELLRGGT
jgi:hypothetical protein